MAYSNNVQQPNVLLLVAEGLSADDAYNPALRIPSLQRLYSQSTRFENAFLPAGSTTPSASSLLTGLWPMSHGGHRDNTCVKDSVTSPPYWYLPLGYRTFYIGERNIGPQSAFPFEWLKGDSDIQRDISLSEVLTLKQPFLAVVPMRYLSQPERMLADYGIVAKASLPNDIIFKPHYPKVKPIEAARTGYLNRLKKLDIEVGNILQRLEEVGKAQNTIVIFTSISTGFFPRETHNLYESGLKVPLVVRWPGRVLSNQKSQGLVSLVDVMPTLSELTGVPMTRVDGRSFVPLLRGARNHRDIIYATHTALGSRGAQHPYPMRSVRSEHYHYIRNLNSVARYTSTLIEQVDKLWEAVSSEAAGSEYRMKYLYRPPEEFYDLRDDPNETTNLIEKPELQREIQAHRREMNIWLHRMGDRGMYSPVTPALDTKPNAVLNWLHNKLGIPLFFQR